MKKTKTFLYESRLLFLANHLEHRVDALQFDYRSFVGSGWGGMQDLSCGTTACAMGHAPLVPELKHLKLRYVRVDETYEDGTPRLCLSKSLGANGDVATPRLYKKLVAKQLKGGMALSAWAAMEIFGLSEDEMEFLFIPGTILPPGLTKPGPLANAREVADHIRAFVARGGLPKKKKVARAA